jgi:hypothetical protein
LRKKDRKRRSRIANKANEAIGQVNKLLKELNSEEVFNTTTLEDKCKDASSITLKQWRNKLRSLMYQCEVIKAEKDQENVVGGPSDFQLKSIKSTAAESLEFVEAEMRSRGDIK